MHEQKLRVFVKKKGDDRKCKASLDVSINWSNIIDKTYLAEDFTQMEMKIFTDMCVSKGINKGIISRQCTYGKSSEKQIVFSK